MKRFVWTLGLGLAGCLIGGKAGPVRGSTIIGLVWGASIGYGFGSIFSQTQATKKLVAYWAGSLGLVGPFINLMLFPLFYPSLFQLAVVGAIDAGIGMLLGFLIGLLHFMSLLRASRVHPGEQAP